MLHTKSVDPRLLELLNAVMTEPAFKDFSLVGGTSLALQIGHRLSVDLDLFGKCEIDHDQFTSILSNFGKVQLLKKSQNILILTVDGIKVDFVNYDFPILKDLRTENQIRLASREDILAMKLNAIAGRGSKKDFIDVYFLLKEFTLEEAFIFYTSKYTSGSEFMVRKSLTYFEDAEQEEMPHMLIEKSWEEIKHSLLQIL